MLEYIELTNWKTHGSSALRFQKGVNVLVGLMGAGKSSVMDAISFALFGTFPALKHKRVKTSDIIRNVPEEHDYAEVTLGFSSDGDSYVVSRRIPKSGVASARLSKNGKPFQTQPTKVTEEIEGLLKIDYDTFSRAVYSEQNNMSYFLDLMKGDRKKQIDSMLGLDHFTTAEEYTTTILNNIRARISGEEQGLAQSDAGAIREQLESLRKERAALAEAQAKLKAGADAAGKEMSAAEKELNRIRDDYSKRKKIEEEIAGLSSRVETLDLEIRKIKEVGIDEEAVKGELEKVMSEQKAAESNAKQLNEDMIKCERGIAKAKEEGRTAESKMKSRDEARAKLDALLKGRSADQISGMMDASAKEISGLNERLAALRNAKAEAEKWAAELKKHFDTCPLCGNSLSTEIKERLAAEKVTIVKESEKGIYSISAEIKERESEASRLRKEHNDATVLEARLKEYEGADKEAKDARDSAAKLAVAKERISASVAEANRQLKEIAEKVTGLKLKRESAIRKREHEAEIAKAKAKIDE